MKMKSLVLLVVALLISPVFATNVNRARFLEANRYGTPAGGGGSAVTFDAATPGSGQNVTQLEVSHTAAGDNRLVVIHVGWRNNAGQFVSSVTYGGHIASTVTPNNVEAGGGSSKLFYLTNPPTGAQTVHVRWSASVPGGGIGVVSVSNAAQSEPFRSTSTASTTGATSISTNAPSALNDLVLDGVVLRDDDAKTPGTDQTERVDTTTTEASIGVTTKAGATGDVAMSQSWATSVAAAQIAVSIKPSPKFGQTPPSTIRMMNGIASSKKQTAAVKFNFKRSDILEAPFL